MAPKRKRPSSGGGFLEGQLLIAMPGMTDKRFARSVIYMCAHSREGAMGLIINQRAHHISFAELLTQLQISTGEDEKGEIEDRPVHIGGPVESGRGFVLHSSDYFSTDSTLPIDDGVCLTATVDILKAIAGGNGPRNAILALGYAGWSPGQIESEMQANGWLNCPADAEIIFGEDLELKYEQALSKLGVNPTHLVSDAGHA
jgi:putative transcriptional regulator